MPRPCPCVVFCLLACTVLTCCAAERVDEPGSDGPLVGDRTPATGAAARSVALVGQVLLPGSGGRRGLELHAWVASEDGEEQQFWILPDAEGHFAQQLPGPLTAVRVFAGPEVYRLDGDDLSGADGNGRVDLGAIDLRERLVVRRVQVRAAAGAPAGLVRLGLWIGPPHTGPLGELPSLGSKQFPSVELGSEVEWLLPPDASAVHFLVERPNGPGRGTEWRSGEGQLFGPYESSSFPLDLAID